MLLLLGAALSVDISIDVGSCFVKSSIVGASRIPDIALNPQQKSTTPTFIAFRAKPTFNTSSTKLITEDDIDHLTAEFGEKALGILALRPQMGSGYFAAFSGVSSAYRDFLSSRLFVSTSLPRFRYDDLIGIFLKLYIRRIADHEPIDHVQLVFPAAATMWQRQIFERTLGTFANFSLLDDVDAVALNYLIERASRFEAGARNVLFVDVGGTSTKAYVVRFEMAKGVPTAIRLSYAINWTEGGAFVTSSLVDLIRRKLKIGNTTDAESLRLFVAAEKAKIQLSEANSVDVIAEQIEGVDRSVTISRSELEKVTELPAAVVAVARNASHEIEVDEVELIGGASKMPAIQSALTKALRKKLYFNLNADEAIALGAGYQRSHPKAAIYDNVQPFKINLTCGWERHEICLKHQVCESELLVPGVLRKFEISYLDGPIHPFLKNITGEIKCSMNLFGNLTIFFGMRPFRLTKLDRCNETCSPGKLFPVDPGNFSRDIIVLFGDPNARALHLSNTRKDIESFALRILDEIAKNQTVRTFTNHTQRLDIIRCTERQKKWIQSPDVQTLDDFANFSLHRRELLKCIAPVYRRINDNRTFWNVAQRIFRLLQQTKKLKGKMKVNDQAPRPEQAKFVQRLQQMEGWFNETMNRTRAAPKWEPLPVGIQAMKQKFYEIDAELDHVQSGIKKSEATLKRQIQDPTSVDREDYQSMRFMRQLRMDGKKPPDIPSGYGPEPDPDVDYL
jgi:hypothetical protein